MNKINERPRIDKGSVFCLIAVAFLAILVLFGDKLAPYDPTQIDMSSKFAPISAEHLLGADYLGRDVFSRIIIGAKSTIVTSTVILVIALVIGVFLGLLAGYVGGKLDWLVMRLVDIAMIFPDYIMAMLIAGILGGGMKNLVLATVIVKWFPYCKIARSIILDEKQKEYVVLARMNGMPVIGILFKHLFPYVLGSISALAIVDIGKIILLIASLSYLGLGFQPPTPEWGAMLNEGRDYFMTQPQMMVYPGLAICITVFIFNIIGSYISKKYTVRDKAGE